MVKRYDGLKGSIRQIRKHPPLFQIYFTKDKKRYFISKDFNGNLPRIELFARQKVEGWDVWGNEVGSTIDLNNPKAKSIRPHKDRITVEKDGVDLGVYQKTFLECDHCTLAI